MTLQDASYTMTTSDIDKWFAILTGSTGPSRRCDSWKSYVTPIKR